MKPTLLLAGFVALAGPASARSDTDYPHRDWGKVATLDMSVTDATACISREMNRNGDVLVIPAEGGNDIDVAPRAAWGPKMEPWRTFKVGSESGAVTLRVFYRHPIRIGAVNEQVEALQRRCLKVRQAGSTND